MLFRPSSHVTIVSYAAVFVSSRNAPLQDTQTIWELSSVCLERIMQV